MEHGKSVLLTFGEPGRLLKRKMVITGLFCRAMLFMIFNPVFLIRARLYPDIWTRRKLSAVKFARFFFPFHVTGTQMAPSAQGQIVVINHPTLNDPICAAIYILEQCSDREIIIPVNLPWFEGVCRYRSKLLKIGVNIVPILTPETAKRLGSNDLVSTVQESLIKNYTAEFAKTMLGGGLAVVAQQATRQRYIFSCPAQAESGEGILTTISLVLAGLRRAHLLEKTSVIPVGVIPHATDAKPKLNPLCRYTLNIGKPILANDLAAVKNDAKRPADLHILLRLADLLPSAYHFASPQN